MVQGDQFEVRECYAMSTIDRTKKNGQNTPQPMDVNTLHDIGEIDLPEVEMLKMLRDLDLRESPHEK